MKPKDFLFAALAGLILIAAWYGQFALSLTGRFDVTFELYIIPLAPTLSLFFLVRNARFKYALIKAGVCAGIFLCLLLISVLFNLHTVLLNVILPDYGGMSGHIRAFIAQSSLIYYIINGIALLASLMA